MLDAGRRDRLQPVLALGCVALCGVRRLIRLRGFETSTRQDRIRHVFDGLSGGCRARPTACGIHGEASDLRIDGKGVMQVFVAPAA